MKRFKVILVLTGLACLIAVLHPQTRFSREVNYGLLAWACASIALWAAVTFHASEHLEEPERRTKQCSEFDIEHSCRKFDGTFFYRRVVDWIQPGTKRKNYVSIYWCPECSTLLSEGPSGGGTNAVCRKCRINYGCLPDFIGLPWEQEKALREQFPTPTSTTSKAI